MLSFEIFTRNVAVVYFPYSCVNIARHKFKLCLAKVLPLNKAFILRLIIKFMPKCTKIPCPQIQNNT